MHCRNFFGHVRKIATTDSNGYFFLQAPRTVRAVGAKRCRLALKSTPKDSPCTKKTNINGGKHGAILKLDRSVRQQSLPFALYTVGPFAFEPNRRYCKNIQHPK